MAPWILSYMNFPHKTYVEVFGGMASLLIQKKPSRVEIYNEKSDEIYNLFYVLRDPVLSKKLIRALRLTPYSRTEWLKCYPRCPNNPVEQARRTIVLLSMAHNPSKALKRTKNGFRTSSSNYQILARAFKKYIENLELIIDRLREVMIENYDCYKIMKQHDRTDTILYCDPPYMMPLRSDRRNLYLEEMGSEEDHYNLSVYLNSVESNVIVSGYECPQYLEWYKGWEMISKRAVTGAAKKGKSTTNEVIWLNPRCWDNQQQQSLILKVVEDEK